MTVTANAKNKKYSLKAGFIAAFLALGWMKAPVTSFAIILLFYLCVLVWVGRVSFTLIKSEYTDIPEFGLEDSETQDIKIKRSIYWSRIAKALGVICWSFVLGTIWYFVGVFLSNSF